MGLVRGHIEEGSRVTHRVFSAGDGEMVEEVTGWSLAVRRV